MKELPPQVGKAGPVRSLEGYKIVGTVVERFKLDPQWAQGGKDIKLVQSTKYEVGPIETNKQMMSRLLYVDM